MLVILLAAGSRGTGASGDEYWDERIGDPGIPESVGGVGVVVYQSELHVFGAFNSAAGASATNIARREGLSWMPLGSGVRGGHIRAAAVSAEDLYVGGLFSEAGDLTTSNVARWDGTNWWALGPGVNGQVRAIAISGSDVFVGGSFTAAGVVSANNIAKWDGTSWHRLGEGIIPVNEDSQFVGAVDSLTVMGQNLYVGGRFRNQRC